MVYLKIMDNAGIGNQMFMFACGYAVAKKTDQKLYIISEFNYWSKREYTLDKLQIDDSIIAGVIEYNRIKSYVIVRIIKKVVNIYFRHNFKILRLIQPHKMPHVQIFTELKKGKDFYLEGYWENYKYFNEFYDDLNRQYRKKHIDDEYTNNMIKEVMNVESVAMHVRYGDFVSENRAMSLKYFEEAMSRIRNLIPQCQFYLFSVDFVIQKYFSIYHDVKIIKGSVTTSDLDEWSIMKHCHHHIVSNSTFSWWAAYLAEYDDKIVIRPSSKYLNGMDEFFPEKWLQ